MSSNDLTATSWFQARKSEQCAAHDGASLLAAAQACCVALPPGPVTLMSTSVQGIALAGAIVALRPGSTRWAHVSWRREDGENAPTAIVEMVRLGEGLRRGLRNRFPGVLILDAEAHATRQSALCPAA